MSSRKSGPDSGTLRTPAFWMSAYTWYMPKVGGQITMSSRPGRQKQRMSRSIASLVPRVTKVSSGATP